jgi:hypothetical protein
MNKFSINPNGFPVGPDAMLVAMADVFSRAYAVHIQDGSTPADAVSDAKNAMNEFVAAIKS